MEPLTQDNNRHNKGIARAGASTEFKKDHNAYPPELRRRHGELTVYKSGGLLYTSVNGKTSSIAKLVWEIHHPDWNSSRVYHIDGNRMDNRISNLTPSRKEAR